MRNSFRTALVLIIVLSSVCIPFFRSGYAEIEMAQTADSNLNAANHYIRAAVRLPWRPDLYEKAGNNFYAAQEYAQADSAYQKASRRNALSAEGWSAWGNVIYLNGDTKRAAQIWEQGLELPDASIRLYSSLADIYQNDGDYETAARFLQRYVESVSDDASAHYRLGLLLTLSNPNEAFSELTLASQLDPEFDPAVQTLRTALNLSSINTTPSEAKVLIGRGLGLVQEWELAQVVFNEATKLDENNAEAWAWLGEANQQTGREEASVYLDRALNLNPNSAVIHGLRGLYFQRVGNHREALNEFQSAARLEPENPNWYVSIGDAEEKTGNLIAAVEAYQYAASLAPDDTKFLYLLADLCARNNAYVKDVGIPAVQMAVQIAPDDPSIVDMLGWLLILDNRPYEAERMLQRALALDDKFADAYYHLALLALKREDMTLMNQYLMTARDLGSSEAAFMLKQYSP